MKFAGLQKTSLIDYPGKISAVVFVSGCNFHCPYCHNADLAKGLYPTEITEQDLLDWLSTRKGLLDGISITGGEPTLQLELTRFCRIVKSMNFKTKLDTNGSRPDVVERLIEDGLIDYIAMDFKSDATGYRRWLWNGDFNRIIESARLIMQSNLPYEFRTTCVYPIVNESIIKEIGWYLNGAERLVLQQATLETALSPEFFERDGRPSNAKEIEQYKTILSDFVETVESR